MVRRMIAFLTLSLLVACSAPGQQGAPRPGHIPSLSRRRSSVSVRLHVKGYKNGCFSASPDRRRCRELYP